jgi:5-oxopent-3-ene-1,2,5-tricarboxylate decarboxylase/2-hydroxyhepta-2,4-diene-1,7-dioate isomerase
MSVLNGPRRELRRIMVEGSTYWATPVEGGLQLGDGRVVEEARVRYLPPCEPTKILCVHTNFRSRVYEFTGKPSAPPSPTYFQKPITALNSHGGELVRPEGCHYLNYEGEVAAMVGRPMRNIQPDEVWDHLAGFAVSNDVGLHDMRDTDMGSMLRVQGQDGFCPSGPGLVSGLDEDRTDRVDVAVEPAEVGDGGGDGGLDLGRLRGLGCEREQRGEFGAQGGEFFRVAGVTGDGCAGGDEAAGKSGADAAGDAGDENHGSRDGNSGRVDAG